MHHFFEGDWVGSRLAVLIIALVQLAVPVQAKNPILADTAFIPDGEPHVFEYEGEQRVFIYGSRDERVTGYCGYGHDVWSAPVDDLTEWTNHGEIFNSQQVLDIGYGGSVAKPTFGAPDCVYNPITGKYYLYTFLGRPYLLDGKEGPLKSAKGTVPGFGEFGPKCVRAVSDSPVGPFTDPVMCDWPAANKAGTFDPSVLVDRQKDGSVKVYAFWGMKKGDRWARLDPVDMHTIIDGETGKPGRDAWHKTLPEPSDTFKSTLFEASSIKKVSDGHYVFIYSANERIPALTYCYSTSPEGPWTYGGRIVDNDTGWKGGNNHGSIVEVNGQWYVVYHRQSVNSYNRQAMMEPINLIVSGDKVSIAEVDVTSQGVETNGLDAFRRYNANIVCYQSKDAFIEGRQRQPDGLNPVVRINAPETILGFKYFNFGPTALQDANQLVLKLNAKLLKDAAVSILVGRVGKADERVPITTATVSAVPGKKSFTELLIPVEGLDGNAALQQIGGLKGQLAVYLSFSGAQGELCQIKELEFAKDGEPTPNPLREIRIESVQGVQVTALPSKGRGGESIKLTLVPDMGRDVNSLRVIDAQGREIEVHQNAIVPHGPISYHFKMPTCEVDVRAELSR